MTNFSLLNYLICKQIIVFLACLSLHYHVLLGLDEIDNLTKKQRMDPVVTKIKELGSFLLGEGPHWDHETQSLYFVDIVNKTINKYVPSLKKHTYIQLAKASSMVIPIQNSSDRFIITVGREIAILTWDGNSTTPLNIEVITTVDNKPGLENNKINDGKADPFGNLWAGTMGSDSDLFHGTLMGSLYSLDFNRQIKCHESNIGVSNGLAWSKDLTKMYYIDSFTGRIDQYDVHVSDLSIGNRQPLFTFAKHGIPGFPDGQTIDADGNLWVAVFQGGRIIKVSTKTPEVLLDTVAIPDWQISSLTFGGLNLDELYVTTARERWHNFDQKIPLNGNIYKVTGLGVKGLPANRINIK